MITKKAVLSIVGIILIITITLFNGCKSTKEENNAKPGENVVKTTIPDAVVNPQTPDNPLRLKPGDYKINNVPDDAPKSEVEKAFGKPNKVESDENDFDPGSKIITWDYDGLSITFADEQLINFYAKSDKYSTPRGAKVGDSKETIIKLYGKPSFEDKETISYFLENDDMHSISFTLKNNIVTNIFVGSYLD